MITRKLIFSTELFCNDLINVICSDTDNKIYYKLCQRQIKTETG